MPKLLEIHRFPLKGFGPDRCERLRLETGKLLPFDRAWAIENGMRVFDPAAPVHIKKKHFLMLAGQPALARFKLRFGATPNLIECDLRPGETFSVDLDDSSTHGVFFAMLENILGQDIRGELRVIRAPNQAMTDIPEPHVSLINAASVRALSGKMGHALDVLRFRGNLIIDEMDAWSEFDLVGRDIRIGEVVLRGESRIGRCAATSVNLSTATRDSDVPAALFEHYGHTQCGLYLSVIQDGEIAVGDEIEPV